MRKKMKNAAVMVLGFALTGAVLAGCGESPQSREETQQTVPISISEEPGQDSAAEKTEAEKTETEKTETEKTEAEKAEGSEKAAQASEGYEDNFAVDSEAAKAFAGKVKEAVAQKDLEALAELTAFPVYVGLPDAGVVETREDFLELGAEAVFTDELLESIETADIENFQPCMAGFSISGEGKQANINFGVTDGALAINGINY